MGQNSKVGGPFPTQTGHIIPNWDLIHMGATVPGAVFEGERVAEAVNNLFTRRSALESAKVPIKKRTVRGSSSSKATTATPTSGTNTGVSEVKNEAHDYRGKDMLAIAKSRKIA